MQKSVKIPRPTPMSVPAIASDDELVGRDTPVYEAHALPTGGDEPTLTLLTGAHAGHSVAVGRLGVIIGRDEDSNLLVEDVNVSRHHARFDAGPYGHHYVEDLHSTNGTFVNGERVTWSIVAPGDLVQLGPHLQLRFSVTASADAVLQRKLYEHSLRDELTQTYNRGHFVERLGSEVALARQAHRDAGLLMIDVDGLKRLNDEHGHLAGDRALAFVASHVKHLIRSGDVLARYGGDEFVLIVRGTAPAQAIELAERIRAAISELRFGAGGEAVAVTVSIGVASLSELAITDPPLVALVALADERLYAAKNAGRNCVRAGGGLRA